MYCWITGLFSMFRRVIKRFSPLILGLQLFTTVLVIYYRVPASGYLARQWTDMKEFPRHVYARLLDGTGAGRQQAIMEERKHVLKQLCSNLSTTDYWSNLVITGEVWTFNNVSYCITPKSGSTFWKRAYRYMAGDFTGSKNLVKSPLDVDRLTVHYGNVKNISIDSIKNVSKNGGFSTSRSFMFARNPYSRLWSAYIDKFLLPDYWRTSAVDVAKFLRPSKISTETECVNDITFMEFLTYITFDPVKHRNEHWEPIHRKCSPCHVTFDVIGKQESFKEDTNYIVDKYGMSSTIWMENEHNRIKREAEMLIRYNFDLHLLRYPLYECYQLLDVAKRLWFAFQLGGYIHRDMDFPKSILLKNGFHGNPSRVLTKIVWKVIDSQRIETKRDLKYQKHKLMLDAYRQIPGPVLKLVRQIYEYDFLLFQYDTNLDLSEPVNQRK